MVVYLRVDRVEGWSDLVRDGTRGGLSGRRSIREDQELQNLLLIVRVVLSKGFFTHSRFQRPIIISAYLTSYQDVSKTLSLLSLPLALVTECGH